MLGYLLLWSVNQLYQLVRREPGIGQGDFKLLAALGAWGGEFAASDPIVNDRFGLTVFITTLRPSITLVTYSSTFWQLLGYQRLDGVSLAYFLATNTTYAKTI